MTWCRFANLDKTATLGISSSAVNRSRPINHAFLTAGGNAAEYGAAMHQAVAHGWLEAHPSGAYMKLTQKGG